MGQPFDPDRQYPPQQPAGWQPADQGAGIAQPGYRPPQDRSSFQPDQQPGRTADRASRRPAVAGLIAGLVVAAIVGGVLAVSGVLHFGSTRNEPARVSAEPLSLPSSLPGFQDYVTVSKALVTSSGRTAAAQASFIDKMQANAERVSSLTRAAYQTANPGAAVAFAQYADSKLERQVNVIAVRATYPGLTNGPVTDPAYLGLSVAPQRIQSFGEVQCLLFQSGGTPAGQQPDPTELYTTLCQRSGPALTIQLFAGAGFAGLESQQTLVNLTNSTWTTLTG